MATRVTDDEVKERLDLIYEQGEDERFVTC